MLRLLAPVAVAWGAAMSGLALLAVSPDAAMRAVGLGVAGAVAGTGLVVARTVRRRYPKLAATSALGGAPPTWSSLAHPRANFANRWAMYDDLAGALGKYDWSGKRVGEFGGANEIFRTFTPGARYELFTYPEHDLQDLRKIADASLDLAILDQTLEHVPDPERALAEVRRVLRSNGLAIVTTPFLVPVHDTERYGDFYRWTPHGMALMLQRCGFTAEVRMWGNQAAASALLGDMYMTAETAAARGLGISLHESEAAFPVTVWALAQKTG